LVRRLLLVVGLMVDSLIVVAFARNLQQLWAILLISLGILIGLFTIRGNGKIAGLICFLALVTVPLIVVIRAMPIYSFEWPDLDGLDRIVIEVPTSPAKFEVTDPGTLNEFTKLVRIGSYETSLKCGECYVFTLFRGPNLARYVLRYDALGHQGGGACETNFVPQKRLEFRKWLEDVLLSRGYAPKSVTSDP
jgi:hypothetical protein